MNLIFRMIFVICRAILGHPLRMDDVGRVPLIVFPNDLDTNFHMNNGRYLTLMDLGRTDQLIRLGLWRDVFKRGWRPVLGSAEIRFKKSLGLFDRFTLETSFGGGDEKYVYIDHRFVRDGRVVAEARVKALFLRDGKPVPTSEVHQRAAAIAAARHS